MGNRAVIATEKQDLAVYLHWNGGRDSVEAFLTYCKICGHRPPESDCYGWARLCQVIANYLGGITSIGIDTYNKLYTSANYDNGVYVIKDWKIIAREKFEGTEQRKYKLEEMLKSINERQSDKLPEYRLVIKDQLINQ